VKLESQIEFLAIVDKLKSVNRATKPIGLSRQENSAEHSWHVMLTALVLKEYANEQIDILKVLKMLALHDIPEIECGDTMHYKKINSEERKLEETAAATKLFSELPKEQADEFLSLWKEFEDQTSPESKFANAVDRLMAFILNPRNEGGSWMEFNISAEMAQAKNSHIEDGSKEIWEYVRRIIDGAREKGFLA